MRITLLVFAALLAVGPMLLRTPGAMACSCMAPPTDSASMRALFEEDAYSDEWIMVTGTASARDKSPVPYSTTTGFTVDRVYRGSAPERIVLLDAEDGASCGMTVDTVGREFVVARIADGGVYEPTFCGSFGVTPALQAELDAASLGAEPAPTNDAGSDSLPYIPIAFIGGAAAILIAAIFAIRRRDQRSPDGRG